MIGTISGEEYEIVPTELEKIHRSFEKKWQHKKWHHAGRGLIQVEWHDYLVKELGLEVVSSETSLASPLDYLLERIYSGNFDRVVVRDPCPSKGFILMGKDFAHKVLVLGDLP
jgi:hypothetical protein